MKWVPHPHPTPPPQGPHRPDDRVLQGVLQARHARARLLAGHPGGGAEGSGGGVLGTVTKTLRGVVTGGGGDWWGHTDTCVPCADC